MSKHKPLINIVKICAITAVLLFAWNTAFGDIQEWDAEYSKSNTTTVKIYVNGEYHPFPIISMTEEPHVIKVTIKNNATGEEKEITTEEEPDCE